MSTPRPNFTIQTASLFASGDQSTFTGTGGPAAFDPFTAEFSDFVSSAGIASEPFNDEVYDVDAGDQVSFVIAIQNFGSVPGYNLVVRDTVPVGFALGGANLTVTDGTITPLAFTGNLFDPTGGLVITPPVAAYSDTSGANVILITFTATATTSIALPGAIVTNGAQIVSYAASNGGANLAGSSPSPLSASTPVQTGIFTVSSTPDQPAATLQAGQTASFDITVDLPEGSTQDFRIDEVLPQIGSAYLHLVSTQIVSVGGHLSTSLPVNVQPNGAIQLGTVVDAADNLVTADDNIVVRVTVSGAGTSAGSGSVNTVVSTADPNGSSTRVSQTVTNTLNLGQPDTPPTLTGTSAAQFATNSAVVLPFANIALTDPDVGQIQTLTIHLSDATLGRLSGASALMTNAAGDATLTGSVAAVQALARTLLFTPTANATGTETIGLTLNDGAGGTATGQVALTIAPATHAAGLVQYPISSQTILTSTATGTSTYAQTETYAGPLSNITSQFLYDGDTTLAIAAQQSGMLISSQAPQTAVQLKNGTNFVDIAQGSGFVVSGTGTDSFRAHADPLQITWDTIANFHTGDTVILTGFTPGVSLQSWDASAGAAGYVGATLRVDADGNGTTDASITFAGKSLTDTRGYTTQYGSNYIAISAN